MFKAGDKVVCTASGGWYWDKALIWRLRWRKTVLGPKKNEVVTVNFLRYNGYISLSEYPGGLFPKKYFRSLHDDFVEEVLEMVRERPIKLK